MATTAPIVIAVATNAPRSFAARTRRIAATTATAAIAAVAAVASVLLVRAGNQRWAFAATATTIAAAVVTLFVSLYPRVLVSDPEFGNSLTVENASSSHYSLVVMTVVAAVLLPVVLLYQAWTYHVFRARLGGEEAGTPVDLLAPKSGS